MPPLHATQAARRLKCRTWRPRPTAAAVPGLRAPFSTTAAPCSAWRPTRPPTSRTSFWSSSLSRARSCARWAPPRTGATLSLATRTPRAHGPLTMWLRYRMHRPLRTACPCPPRNAGAAHERCSHRRGPAGDLAARTLAIAMIVAVTVTIAHSKPIPDVTLTLALTPSLALPLPRTLPLPLPVSLRGKVTLTR